MDRNQRQSIRMPLGETRPAELLLHGKHCPARIVDLSSGGFGILVASDAQIESGEELHLGDENAVHLVQVCHIEKLEEGQRIGLKRLRTLGVDVLEGPNADARPGDIGLRTVSPEDGRIPPIVTAAILCLLLVGMIGGVGWIWKNSAANLSVVSSAAGETHWTPLDEPREIFHSGSDSLSKLNASGNRTRNSNDRQATSGNPLFGTNTTRSTKTSRNRLQFSLQWLWSHGFDHGVERYGIVDPNEQKIIVVADQAWPHGLKPGSKHPPAAITLGASERQMQATKRLGILAFRDLDTFASHLKAEYHVKLPANESSSE